MNFQYNATVTRVIDGDTIQCLLDFGFRHTWGPITLRLWGIDTPEMRGPERPEGEAVKAWLEDRILGRDVLLYTIKDKRQDTDERDSFGRYLASIYVDGVNINDELLRLGKAEVYEG